MILMIHLKKYKKTAVVVDFCIQCLELCSDVGLYVHLTT